MFIFCQNHFDFTLKINKHHFQVQFDHIQTLKTFEISTQNHRLTPLEKNPRWRQIKFDIFIYRQNHLNFTLKHQQILFLGSIWLYTNFKEIWYLDPKSKANPFGKKSKMAADQIWHPHISSGSLWFHSRTSTKVISRSNLTIYKLWRNWKFWPTIVG